MVTLAINTSSSIESVALLNGQKLLGETIWKGQRDESEKLLYFISELLKSSRLSFCDIGRIVVVRGPGPFSALRIGVTVANVLAHCLGSPLFSIDTPALWRARTRACKSGEKYRQILFLHAGGDFVSMWGSGFKGQMQKIGAALKILESKFGEKPLAFFGDISENEMREFLANKCKTWKFVPENLLKTFGKAVAGLKNLKMEKIVTPKYSRPPNITKPK